MQTIWQSLCLQYFRTNPHDEDFFVIGAVENADATTLWQALCGAPQNCQPRPWPENQQHRMPVGDAMQSLQVAQRINLLGQKFFIAMLGLAGCVLPWWAISGD
ncbi:MAG: hypothetical protein Q8K22_07330 [Rhodoferax sp.]|nr:hypothetical protein [Rhodoferax sp.]